MTTLAQLIREDFSGNRSSGLLTVIFIVNYRLGRYLLIRRRNGKKLAWIPYAPALVFSRILSLVFGCSAPFSCALGRRVIFPHGLQGIFISGKAEVGDDCTIMHQVTIGSNFLPGKSDSLAPSIGRNTFIGVGAKIIGGISIGDNVKVGANALVVSSVESDSVCLAPKATIIKK